MLVACNIGISIYIFIKLVIFTIIFLLSSTVMLFLHCEVNVLIYEKKIDE